MEDRKVEVFMISSTLYRSADLIVSFLSKDYGKMTSVIYGGKRVGKQNSFGYQVGDKLQLDCQKFENKDFIKISGLFPLKHNDDISANYHHYLFHCYLHELVNRMAHPEHPEKNLFEILDIYQAFNWDGERSYNLMALLMWKVILHSGLGIHYFSCSDCGKHTFIEKMDTPVFRKESYHLFPNTGELRCSTCSRLQLTGQPFTGGMVKLLWLMDYDPFSFLENSRIPKDILNQLIIIFCGYLTEVVGGKLRSKDLFLQSLKMKDLP